MKNYLKKWREHRDLSQWGLAVRAKVSTGMLSAIEKWDYVPGPAVRARIAAALGIDVKEVWPSLSNDQQSAFRGKR